MKFIKYAMFLLLSVSTLNADPFCCQPSCCSLFEGYYAGVAGGFSTHHSKIKTDSFVEYLLQGNGFHPSLSLNSHNRNYKNGGFGEIFLGYGRVCDNWYYGGRIGVNFSNGSPKSKAQSENIIPLSESEFLSALLTNKAKSRLRNVEFTTDFKFGWIFCDRTMFYGIVGAAFNEQKLRGKSEFVYTNGVDVEGITISDGYSLLKCRKKECTIGLRLGFGLEHFITDCISVYTSYVYTDYTSLRKHNSDEYEVDLILSTTVPVLLPHEATFKSEDHKHVVSVGLALYF
jgi:opacity protein-like surface antigen